MQSVELAYIISRGICKYTENSLLQKDAEFIKPDFSKTAANQVIEMRFVCFLLSCKHHPWLPYLTLPTYLTYIPIYLYTYIPIYLTYIPIYLYTLPTLPYLTLPYLTLLTYIPIYLYTYIPTLPYLPYLHLSPNHIYIYTFKLTRRRKLATEEIKRK
jgi:hypothetical protein